MPTAWAHGVMRIESGGRTMLDDRAITSPAAAVGLTQVMPATIAESSGRYGLGRDRYGPRANILAGAAHLREMDDRYGLADVLAACNARPSRVDDHRRSGRAWPAETQRSVPTLAPQLVGDGAPTSTILRDLTRLDAMGDIARASAFARTMRRPASEGELLFVMTGGSLSTRDRHDAARPNDSLFVGLTREDGQRESRPPDTQQDRPMCRPDSSSGFGEGREGGPRGEGKIEGRGTRQGSCPGLHVGFGGTPPRGSGAPEQAKDLEVHRKGCASSAGVRWSAHQGVV